MARAGKLSEYGGGFLLACLIAVFVYAFAILRPFLEIFFVALVLATVSQPAHAWILRRTRGRAAVSALLTCVLVVLLLILPGLILLGLLAKESLQLYEWIDGQVQSGLLDRSLIQSLLELQRQYLPQLDLRQINIGQILAGVAEKLSGLLLSWSASALKTMTTAVWQFFLMLFALFYFLKDGEKFLRWVMHLTPLPASLEREIFQRFKAVSESAFYGTFLTALAQGILGAIAFLIVGLQPLVWGVAMAFFSMIPVVGTAIVWGPAALLLILSHRLVAGIFLVAWGIVVVGTSDNLLRPLLMKGKSELPPVLIFFSLLGGISVFGPLGILLGPLAIVLVIALLQAYEEAARPLLEDLDGR
ncbi:MAG: AI-2E family transporter [Candidatus Bipolaricaulia bacterium]